jgi:phosphatidylserine/phosphatidylglycerophosphate/cardiolipin synthase-like enzyme
MHQPGVTAGFLDGASSNRSHDELETRAVSMFSMFVNSPPAGTPVKLVYFEKRAFGPFGQAAGEVSGLTGFSEVLWLDVAQSAPEKFRTLLVVCNGTLRVLGPQQGFPANDPAAPLVVELVSAPRELRELNHLCSAQKTETPRRIIYHGIDPPSLTAALDGYFSRLSTWRVLDTSTNRLVAFDFVRDVGQFLSGKLEVQIIDGAGLPLGRVSDKNLEMGYFAFGIEVQTSPPLAASVASPVGNHLDPVTLFSILASGKLSDGKDAIESSQKQNSWLDNVTKSRVLITFRDEWNAALLSPVHGAIIEGPGPGQAVTARLDKDHVGTVVAPSGWSHYTCSVGVPSQRKLTPVASTDGAADPLTIDATAPAHRVIASVRPEDWFHPSDPPFTGTPGFDLPLYTAGNIVTPLIDGLPAFKQLVADLRALDDSSPPSGQFPDNFVLLAGWFMDLNFPLVPGDPSSTVKELLLKGLHSNHKLIVRGLIWIINDPATFASKTIAELDPTQLTDAYPVRFPDPNPLPEHVLTSFHWKCAVVRNRNGTFASLGGIDINPNRLDDANHRPPSGKPYHDVNCRIQGPAVADVTRAFLARWGIDAAHGDNVTNSITPTVTTPPGVPATHMVQIARTFRSGTGPGFQPWSPDGERTIWATLRRAIDRARRYIYIEEQYLVAAMLRDALLAALAKPDSKLNIVIVIPDEPEGDAPILATATAYNRARYLFLEKLIVHPRFTVLSIKDYYVHTKVTIVDDIFATIGSANMNRRGLTYDAEINAFVLDGRVDEGMRKFARDLRTRLWSEHLGMPLTAASFSALNDIDRALDIMRNKRPQTSRLIPYMTRVPGSDYPAGWDDIIDPSGV